VVVAYLCPGQDGCLNLFPETTFQTLLEEMKTRVFPGAEQRAARRLFFANTLRVELDASGRVLIPEKLKQRVGLGKEVVMVGVEDRAEIWNKEVWESYAGEHDTKLDELDSVIPGSPPGPGS
jgi:MraZ protein